MEERNHLYCNVDFGIELVNVESRLLCCTRYIAMRASKSIPNIDCFDVQVESIAMNMYALHNQQFFSAQLMVAIHVDKQPPLASIYKYREMVTVCTNKRKCTQQSLMGIPTLGWLHYVTL